MIDVKIKNNLNFPQIKFLDDLQYIAQRIFVPIMQQNIETQISIDGQPLPQLEAKTLARKARLGQGSKALIATRELIESFYASPISDKTVVLSLGYTRKEIAGYLQVTGIRTKNGQKYFKFFGINGQMEDNAVAYMKNRIKEAIQNAGSK